MNALFSDVGCNRKPFKALEKGSFLLIKKTFTKADRIRTSTEYRALSKHGTRHYSDHFIFVSRRNPLSICRLGITVSKKVGNAVTRNRIKRIVREYFRLNRSLISGRLDINIIAIHSSGRIGGALIRDHLESCFYIIAGKTEQRDDD